MIDQLIQFLFHFGVCLKFTPVSLYGVENTSCKKSRVKSEHIHFARNAELARNNDSSSVRARSRFAGQASSLFAAGIVPTRSLIL